MVGIDCFTDYYDPALKEENADLLAAAGCDLRRSTSPRTSSTSRGFDGVFHLAGAARRAQLRRRVPRSTCATTCSRPQRVFEAAARDGVRVVFASSSSVYGAAERYPTPEDTPPQPLSPYGITKLACEHLAEAYARAFGLDCVVLRYFNAFGPRQRPGHGLHAHRQRARRRRAAFELYGDGDQSRGWTYVGDVVDATIAAMGRGSGTYNVGGALEASMNETIALLEQISGRTLDVDAAPGRARRPAAHERRHDAHPQRARLGADGLARGRSARPVGVGLARVAAA